uniref:Uncharacterized protein n=1 Tax=Arundo donax TaxID=35708 RepID=A0A0A9GLH1_ARUDO
MTVCTSSFSSVLSLHQPLFFAHKWSKHSTQDSPL